MVESHGTLYDMDISDGETRCGLAGAMDAAFNQYDLRYYRGCSRHCPDQVYDVAIEPIATNVDFVKATDGSKPVKAATSVFVHRDANT